VWVEVPPSFDPQGLQEGYSYQYSGFGLKVGSPRTCVCSWKIRRWFWWFDFCRGFMGTYGYHAPSDRTDRPSDRPSDRLYPIRQVPTYPIFCAVKATILGHMLAPFWGWIGWVLGGVQDGFSGHLEPPEIRQKFAY